MANSILPSIARVNRIEFLEAVDYVFDTRGPIWRSSPLNGRGGQNGAVTHGYVR